MTPHPAEGKMVRPLVKSPLRVQVPTDAMRRMVEQVSERNGAA